jgi:hypothetical protein
MELNYPKLIWKCVLDAACEVGKGVFTARDIIERIHGAIPEIPAASIRSYVIAMAPNHPSSHIYASTRKNHPYFEYLGRGRYRLKKEPGGVIPTEIRGSTANSKADFLQKYKETVLYGQLRTKLQ